MVVYVCDDEIEYTQQIEGFIADYCSYNECKIIVKTYSDEYKMLMELSKYADADLIFIDIKLQKNNGIDIAGIIKRMVEGVSIAFITGQKHQESVYSSLRIEPLGYVEKPLKKGAILKIVDLKRERILDMSKNEVQFVCEHKKIPINADKIFYISSNLRKIMIVTANEVFYCYEKLDDVEKKMNETNVIFTRIHKSLLVNFRYVSRYEHDKVIMMNGVELPISRAYKKNVCDAYYSSVIKKYS